LTLTLTSKHPQRTIARQFGRPLERDRHARAGGAGARFARRDTLRATAFTALHAATDSVATSVQSVHGVSIRSPSAPLAELPHGDLRRAREGGVRDVSLASDGRARSQQGARPHGQVPDDGAWLGASR